MTLDPYKTLGISPQLTDHEVKDAYKKLVKKYHPDRYQDEQMKRVATEKMAEINTAYDAICEDRRRGIGAYGAADYRRQPSGTTPRQGQTSGRARTNFRQTYKDFNTDKSFAGIDYAGVRTMIYSGRLAEAEAILERIPSGSRTAEWYYLKGIICQKRGWLDNAYAYVAQATRMSGNPEYVQTLQQMNRQRGGYMTGRAQRSDTTSDQVAQNCDVCCEGCFYASCCCCDLGDFCG